MTDFTYGVLTLHGAFEHQLWLDAGWIGSYVLWGVAGLHPSMARLAEPAPRRERLLTRFRLGLLTARSLVAPAHRPWRDDFGGNDSTRPWSRSARSALFALVVLRWPG